AAAGPRALLVGQSNTGAWNDLTSSTGANPQGGSVYYSVRDGGFSGACGTGCETGYASFLADRGKQIEVGVSWKDDPPGWDGADADKQTASQQATAAIAEGGYDGQFAALSSFIAAHPAATFLIRVDYEVSSAFFCAGGTDCTPYKNAFRHVVQLVRGQSGAGSRVQFVYHPVRGEFDKLYPGDDVTDWVGVSVFDQDLCQPYRENGTTYWNGTEDTAARTCSGYYDDYVNGNVNAIPHGYPVDLNILRMMWWAQSHGKPMLVAESGVQRMSDDLAADGTQHDSDVTAFMQRLATLTTYRGPLPNGVVDGAPTHFIGTGYDLSQVIRAVTYINVDWRYGFDGQTSPGAPIALPPTSGWYVNSLVSRYPQGRAAFCSLLTAGAFATTCA
ncbi:glycoside hydrolase family 26 protein, partial [Actinacidiphila rubida]